MCYAGCAIVGWGCAFIGLCLGYWLRGWARRMSEQDDDEL
jgi:hypothetical protein